MVSFYGENETATNWVTVFRSTVYIYVFRLARIRQWEGAAAPVHPLEGGCWALYLVIYAAKRGVLEVWRMRHGSMVATVSVGTNAR